MQKEDDGLEKERKKVFHVRDYLKQGEKCEASGDFQGAIDNYTNALNKIDYYLLHYKRACAYQKMGEMEKAAKDFKVFLSADTRDAKLGDTPWGFLAGAIEIGTISTQRTTAQKTLTKVTFQNILKHVYPFDVDYTNKKLYNWKSVTIADTPKESRNMQREEPQEAAFRLGVKSFLQGKHEDATRRFGEAINLNHEDSRSYLFRSMVYAVQSHKGGRFGPTHSAQEHSKAKFESDLERALALSEDNAAVEHSCGRLKRWLADYERELTSQAAQRSAIFAFETKLLGSVAGLVVGSLFTFSGIMTIASSLILAKIGVNLILGSGSLLCGVLSLFSTFSFRKRKNRQGGLLIIAGLLIFTITIVISLGLEPL